MPHVIVGVGLVLHGLITTMIGFGSVTSPNSAAIPAPAWFNWWPGAFGRSWLLDALNLGTGANVLGGLVWLAAGIALLGAGLGWLSVSALSPYWQTLALVGGALGLVALALYFHPFYVVAVVINVAILLLVWGRPAVAG